MTQLLLGSLWTLTLGTLLPRCKEAQIIPQGETTWRGHVWVFELGAASDAWKGVPAGSQH